MIYLNSGTNSVVVTPYQRATLVQPYYTWQIVRKGTFEEVVFYQSDSSYAPWYWSSFTISVAPTQSGLTAGIIVANSGEWTYNIYEMASPYDLNLANAITLCETGILIINGTYSTNHEYDQTDNSDIKYYKNM